jgi:hypothetical protein
VPQGVVKEIEGGRRALRDALVQNVARLGLDTL